MTFEQIRDHMLIISNQYYIGLDSIEVDDVVLQGLIERALSVYNNYRVRNEIVQLSVSQGRNVLDKVTTDDGVERTVENIKNIYLTKPYLSRVPITFNWNYDRNTKILYIQVGGSFYFDLMLDNTLDDIRPNDKEFFDLLLGLYLMYISSPRKNFRLMDLPFENDGTELFENGREIYNSAIEKLSEVDGNWFLAVE